MVTTTLETRNSTAAIFARVWEGGKATLSAPIAKHILKLGFDADDECRIHELLERNRNGTLTEGEREELDNFVLIGDLLAILQSKARKVLKRPSPRG